MISKLEIFIAKNAIKLVLALAAAVLVVSWLGYNSWRNASNAENRAEAVKTVGKATTNAGQAAVNTTQGNQDKNNDTDKKTASIVNNFNTYPQAKVAVDPALFDAFRRGVCMYRSAADLPECRAVQQVRPE